MTWLARQNGVPENRIVRFLAGDTGYILRPGMRRPSLAELVPSAYQIARLPYTEAPIRQMTGFEAFTPSHIAGTTVITGALRNSDAARGAFVGGAFVPFTVDTGVIIGAFRHRYTDGDTELTRMLSIASNGDIKDTETGTTLTRSGTFFPSVDVLTWVASPNGRNLIFENTPTLSPNPGDTSQPTTRNVRLLEIDFMGSPQITVTNPEDVGPYGTEALNVSGFDSTHTWNATYPLCFGVDDDGLKTITISESGNASFSSDADPGSLIVYGGIISNPPVHLFSGETYDYSWDYTHTVTITLPGGASKQFTLINTQMEAQSSCSGTNATISLTKTTEQAALGIIYADPTIPLVVYALHKTVSSTSANSNISLSPETFPSHSVPTSGTVIFSRTVGVLVGNTDRTLFTESASAQAVGPEPNRLAIKTGFVDGDEGGGGVDPIGGVPYLQIARPTFGSSSTTTDIDLSQVFFKQLRRVETPENSPLAYFGGLDRGRLFPNDVASGNFNPDIEPSYWVVAKDADNWLVGVNRRKNLDGTTVNDFQMYAGALTEPELRQRFIDYLLEALNTAEPPDTTAIADLEDGDLTPYRVSLHPTSSLLALR